MTDEAHIEEILIEASVRGLRAEVLQKAADLREINMHITRIESFERAFNLVCNE